jgi:hypothetical protein
VQQRSRARPSTSFAAAVAVTLACAGLLGGCGRGAAPVVAVDDHLLLEAGGHANLLANDSVQGAPAVAGDGGNVSFEWLDPARPGEPQPVSVAADGTLSVAEWATPGTLRLSYRLCMVDDGAACATAAVELRVTLGAINGVDDDVVLREGDHVNVLDNDVFGSGGWWIASEVDVVATTPLPPGLMLSPTGGLAIDAAAAAPGRHVLGYRVCERLRPDNCGGAQATVTVPDSGELHGQVLGDDPYRDDMRVVVGDLETTPTLCASAHPCTAPSGVFGLADVPVDGRTVVNVEMPPPPYFGPAFSHSLPYFVETTAVVATRRARNVVMAASVLSPQAQVPFDPDAGAVLRAGAVAQWTRPGGSVRTPTGEALVDPVARLTAFDLGVLPTSLPGDHSTLVDGTPQPLAFFAAAQFDLYEYADGFGPPQRRPLQLLPGSSARIPVSVAGAVPTRAPLWFFDKAVARWVPRGSADLVEDRTQHYFAAPIGAFGTWAVGRPVDSVRLRGCVVDAAGRSVIGATVRTETGATLNAVAATRTDAAGRFELTLPRHAVATLRILDDAAPDGNAMPVAEVAVGPYGADHALQACLVGAGDQDLQVAFTTDICSFPVCWHMGTVTLRAPDGTDLLATAGSLTAPPYAGGGRLARLQVGTYRFDWRRDAGSSFPFDRVPVSLRRPGQARQDFDFAPSTTPAGEAPWRVFEFDVDARCQVTVRRVLAPAGADPPPVAAGYCTP